MLPDFVIIGAQKSASTFLQTCLNDHPDIYLPRGETPFFESPDYEQSDLIDLESLFDQRHERCIGIKRPNYIGKPEVAGRIQHHLPDSKIIAILRNPVHRAVSAYYHNIRYGFLPPLPVEIGMNRILSEPSFSIKYKRAPEIIEFGYYFKYLSQYSTFKQRKCLLVFLYEEFISKPLESIQTAYAFLGVQQNFTPEHLQNRKQKTIYNLNRLRILRINNKLRFNYNENRTRIKDKKSNPFYKIASHSLLLFDKAILSRFFSSNGKRISPGLEKKLYGIYSEDISSLEGFLRRSLSHWKPGHERPRQPA
jgi:hypothetical protein